MKGWKGSLMLATAVALLLCACGTKEETENMGVTASSQMTEGTEETESSTVEATQSPEEEKTLLPGREMVDPAVRTFDFIYASMSFCKTCPKPLM